MNIRCLVFIVGSIFLVGCVSSDVQSEHQEIFNHVMVNGEVLSSDTNEYGLVQAMVRYDDKLYRCVRRPIDFDFCDQL